MSDLINLIRRAETFRRLETDHLKSAWWTGYMRGLRRAHHGESFGTEDDHQIWQTKTGFDVQQDASVAGYLSGLTGQWMMPPGDES